MNDRDAPGMEWKIVSYSYDRVIPISPIMSKERDIDVRLLCDPGEEELVPHEPVARLGDVGGALAAGREGSRAQRAI